MHTPRRAGRKTVHVALVAALAALACAGRAASAADRMPATGRILYRMSSSMMNGTVVMAWADHGKKSRQDIKLTVGGQGGQASISTWSLTDGTYVYSYQPTMGNQVMRMRLAKAAQAAGSMGVVGGVPAPGMAGSGKVVGKGTVLGHPCEIRALGIGSAPGRTKVWLWNGMPLKVEGGGPGGGMTMVATGLDTAPKLSPASFRVPPGYQIKDVQLPVGRPGGTRAQAR